MDWSEEEISLLRRAVARYPSSYTSDKNERWKYISRAVGTRGKRDCYSKYKELSKSSSNRPIQSRRKHREKYNNSDGQKMKFHGGDSTRPMTASESLHWHQNPMHDYGGRNTSDRQGRDYTSAQNSDRYNLSDAELSQLLQKSLQLGTGSSNIQNKDNSSNLKEKRRNAEEKAFQKSNMRSVRESKFDPAYRHSFTTEPRVRRNKESNKDVKRKNKVKSPVLELEELNDFELEDDFDDYNAYQPSSAKTKTQRRQSNAGQSMKNVHKIEISLEEAKGIRSLLYGEKNTTKSLPPSWMNQGFCFSKVKDLRFGLVQHEGGPCGVIASVQAIFLKYLLFELDVVDWQNPSTETKDHALVLALSEIIWNAGDGKRALVSIYSPTAKGSASYRASGYKPDGTTDKLVLHRVHSKNATENIISDSLDLFKAERGPGVVMLLCSCILSRRNVKEDFDVGLGESATLIGTHNYASQELVNLFLVGRAFSNVFDGMRELDSGSAKEENLKLRGIPKKGEVGFLTLFEHYKYMEVGKNFKSPKYPIWVICSESHYSVLFKDPANMKTESKSSECFDMHYYDELGRQQETYKLTVDPDPVHRVKHSMNEKDLISPIEHCIRTRWPGATVDWNGAEPLL